MTIKIILLISSMTTVLSIATWTARSLHSSNNTSFLVRIHDDTLIISRIVIQTYIYELIQKHESYKFSWRFFPVHGLQWNDPKDH